MKHDKRRKITFTCVIFNSAKICKGESPSHDVWKKQEESSEKFKYLVGKMFFIIFNLLLGLERDIFSQQPFFNYETNLEIKQPVCVKKKRTKAEFVIFQL